MPDYENAIEIKDLTKKYDGFTLDSISFAVPKGCIMGFIGQNGAGKTTTIRALLNIIKTDGGTINMLGLDHIKDEYAIKEQIAAVFRLVNIIVSIATSVNTQCSKRCSCGHPEEDFTGEAGRKSQTDGDYQEDNN